jgi:hypothetical protein
MSLRAPPDHHQLIRDIAMALRTRPELADVLRDVLQTQHGIAVRDTDVLQAMQEKLALQERTTLSLMAMVENIADRVKVLEQPEGPKAAKPRQARPAAAGRRRARNPTV